MRGARPVFVVVFAVLSGCNAILGLDPEHLRADSSTIGDGGATDVSIVDDGAADAGGSAYAREVLTDKPILYYRFGETGGLTVHDETHTLDATYPSFGVTFAVPGAIAGDPDTAIALGGQSKIQVPPGADFAGNVTYSLEMWLRIDATPTVTMFVIDHEKFPEPRNGWDVVLDTGGTSFERYGAAGNTSVGTTPLALSTWTHLFYTWDGSTGRTFVNGKLAGENGWAFDIDAVTYGFTIGGQNCSCGVTFYAGALDELAIYDHVVGGERVQAHLHAAGL